MPSDKERRPDAVEVTPGTIEVRVEVPGPRILMRPNAWVNWAEVAIDHERYAEQARQERGQEWKPGVVAIVAAAAALEALYDTAAELVPLQDQPAEPRGGAGRGHHVAERLKRGVSPGSLTQEWPRRIGELFELRHRSVHFEQTGSEPPVWHEALGSHVAPHIFGWRLEAASDSVAMMLEVLEAWAHHPSRWTEDWAPKYAHAVDRLAALRRGDA